MKFLMHIGPSALGLDAALKAPIVAIIRNILYLQIVNAAFRMEVQSAKRKENKPCFSSTALHTICKCQSSFLHYSPSIFHLIYLNTWNEGITTFYAFLFHLHHSPHFCPTSLIVLILSFQLGIP